MRCDRQTKSRKETKHAWLNFTAPTREQLEKKLAKINSPMIIYQSWTSTTGSPGTIDYTVGIKNPAVCPGDRRTLTITASPDNPFISAELSGQEAEWFYITLE